MDAGIRGSLLNNKRNRGKKGGDGLEWIEQEGGEREKVARQKRREEGKKRKGEDGGEREGGEGGEGEAKGKRGNA